MSTNLEDLAFVVGATIAVCLGLVEMRGCQASDDNAKIEMAKSQAAAATACIQSQRPAAECALIIHGTSKP